MSDPVVLKKREGAVTLLTLNRPDRHNAWTHELGELYFDLLDEAASDPDIRAIVVTGAGRGFCPGFDALALKNSAAGKGSLPAKGRRMTHAMSIRKPIIGAINGACAGFGLVQAMHFDVRFAAEGAVFATAFTRWGLNAEYGASWLMPRIVGQTRAMDLILSGRKFDAAEAERIGLVSAVLPGDRLLEHAMAYARDLAEYCSRVAMADSKMQVLTDWDMEREATEDRAKAFSHTPGHRVDFAEGVACLIEKRPPRLANLPSRQAR